MVVGIMRLKIVLSKSRVCHQARHQSQPSAVSGTSASQVQVYVAKCYACHANRGGDHGTKREPSAPAQCHKRHACHAKWRSMSPSLCVGVL